MRALLVVLAAGAFSQLAQAAPRTVTLSIVGTSDLHGHVAALPWLSGYLTNLRHAREADGGAVILLDAGDMFQGTLESNLDEGAPVVRAYDVLGYAAVAIGNHEFDFGPAGPAPSPEKPGDDPQGALKARASEARFPFLAANTIDLRTGNPVTWPHVAPSTIVETAGLKVGIVGVVTANTGRMVLPANVAGLNFSPLAQTIAQQARRLRAHGATIVIAVAHEGGACNDFTDPDRLDSCDTESAIFSLARSLPRGSVDAIVAGHTHQAVAQRVAKIPIIQSYANGRAFGRIDLTVLRARGRVVASHIEAPREICPASTPENCKPADYEGRPVVRDEKLAGLLVTAFVRAREKGEERLGVEIVRPLPHRRGQETTLGNLLADLMRAANPGSSVAILNNGGIRAGLPQGPLTYGRLYETFPFDNIFASLRLSAGALRADLARSLGRSGSLFSLSGLRALARCKDGRLDMALTWPDGSPVRDDDLLDLVTTDFLATGGDGFLAGVAADPVLGIPVRDALAEALRKRGGTLAPDDPALFDPARRRVELPGAVPIKCEK